MSKRLEDMTFREYLTDNVHRLEHLLDERPDDVAPVLSLFDLGSIGALGDLPDETVQEFCLEVLERIPGFGDMGTFRLNDAMLAVRRLAYGDLGSEEENES